MRRRLGGGTCACLLGVWALASCSPGGAVVADRADRVSTVSPVESTPTERSDDTVGAGPSPDTTPDTSSDTSPDTGSAPTGTGGAPTLPSPPPPGPAADPDSGSADTPADGSGGDGVGDELFPELGNPGIDVEHYDVALAYLPESDTIVGSVTLSIVPTADLATFTLDSAGPDVSAVSVAGEAATFEQERVELRIAPASRLEAGTPVDVVVEYSATPGSSDSAARLPNGWFHTDGGSYVLNEPDGARSWLPSNDHPSDKATYTFRITVPKGLTAVANGRMTSMTSEAAGDVWVWEQAAPMATYLILLLTGDYEMIESAGPNGLPLISAVLRDDVEVMQPYLDTIDDQIDFFDDWFGPFPLPEYGIAMTDSFAGLAMETQGRPVFSREDFASGELGYIQELLLSHELAHMWFGDAVTLAEWQDIWLNESFASYAQWMWLEEVGFGSVEEQAADALEAKVRTGAGSTATPDVEELFEFNSYDGGAVILHALRLTIGDDRFFELLQRWVADNAGESRHTEDFVALAGEVSGTDLTAFFADWLYSDSVPDGYPVPVDG